MAGWRNIWMALCGVIVLAACGGGGVGPGDKPLIGTWQLEGAQTVGGEGSNIRIENAVISYERDGTSDYSAVLVIDDPTLPESDRSFQLDGDVRWTLEETVLTRTLEEMRVSPVTDTPQSTQTAEMLRQGLNSSPPAQFIVETVNDAQLVLLDPDSGNTLRFTRQ